MQELWITSSQVGEILHCSARAVRNIDESVLPYVMVGTHRKYRLTDAQALCAKRASQNLERWAIYCPKSDTQSIVYTEGDKDEIDALLKYHGSGLYNLIACCIWGHYAIETPYTASEQLNITPTLNCSHPQKRLFK